MINERKLELLCILCLLNHDQELTEEENNKLYIRFLELKKEFVEQYM